MLRRLTPLVALSALILLGCNTSPTQIDGGPMVFEGTIEMGGTRTHLFTITTSGGVSVEVLSLVAMPEIEIGSPTLGLALGQPDAAGECVVTYNTTVAEGSRLSIGLEEREYCLLMFDNGFIAEDAERIYSVQISPAGS